MFYHALNPLFFTKEYLDLHFLQTPDYVISSSEHHLWGIAAEKLQPAQTTLELPEPILERLLNLIYYAPKTYEPLKVNPLPQHSIYWSIYLKILRELSPHQTHIKAIAQQQLAFIYNGNSWPLFLITAGQIALGFFVKYHNGLAPCLTKPTFFSGYLASHDRLNSLFFKMIEEIKEENFCPTWVSLQDFIQELNL